MKLMATMEEYTRLLELDSLNSSHISQFEKTMKFRMGEIQLQSEVVKMCEVDFTREVGMQSTLLELLKEEYRRLHIKFTRTPRELEN